MSREQIIKLLEENNETSEAEAMSLLDKDPNIVLTDNSSLVHFAIEHNHVSFLRHCIRKLLFIDWEDEKVIVEILSSAKRFVDLESKIDGRSILDDVKDISPTSPVFSYYYQSKIAQYLKNNQEQDAIDLLNKHPEIMRSNNIFKGILPDGTKVDSSLSNYANQNKKTNFSKQRKDLPHLRLVTASNPKAAIEELIRTNEHINFEHEVDGKSYLDYIKEGLPNSTPWLDYYYQSQIIL